MGVLSEPGLPKRAYVECFRVVVWQFLNYQVLLGDISPSYDECPLVCFKQEGNGEEFCEGCEIKAAKDIFKEETTQALDDRFEDRWKIYDFDMLLESVIGIVNSEDDDKTTWSPTTELLFDVYIGQRTRLRRIDDWNLKQKLKNREHGD